MLKQKDPNPQKKNRKNQRIRKQTWAVHNLKKEWVKLMTIKKVL